jgi:predicted nucleic acid-binding protein
MNVLIDTNIFISREDYKEVPSNLSSLLELFEENLVKIYIHPLSKEDVKRDRNLQRMQISLSKMASYPELVAPPIGRDDTDFVNTVGVSKSTREAIDNELLYAVYKDAVNFLITNDKEILNKAQKVGLADRVLNVEEGLDFFSTQFVRYFSTPTPAIKRAPVYNLDLSDSIFSELRKEYPDFSEWWKKISREGRSAWVFEREDKKLGGILILNQENEPIDSIPPMPKKKRLKICTFNVTHRGRKLGELFLKVAIRHAIENNLNEIYLTHYSKPNDPLVNLLEEYGFTKLARKPNGENVYFKLFDKAIPKEEIENTRPVEFNKRYYPAFYDGQRVKKHIIPIRPHYHDRLFLEYRRRIPSIFEGAGELITEGNTIKKAYICHTKSKKLNSGDILSFYRSTDRKELTSICTTEKVFQNVRKYEDVIKLVGSRTVYSKNDLLEILGQGPATIIIFLLHFDLKRYISLNNLQRAGIVRRAPQSVMEISDEGYRQILKMGGLDERFTFH